MHVQAFADVSIHAPVWGRHGSKHTAACRNWFQSTPPCGGDQQGTVLLGSGKVSIHAPVWGRQPYTGAGCRQADVSIHAPVWGRPVSSIAFRLTSLFQSTPPCGGDYDPWTVCGSYEVSIHAPVWGRLTCKMRIGGCDGFNPRPRVGATFTAQIRHHAGPVSIHAPVWGRQLE